MSNYNHMSDQLYRLKRLEKRLFDCIDDLNSIPVGADIIKKFELEKRYNELKNNYSRALLKY